MASWERSGTRFKSLGNAIKDNMLAGVAGLVHCENLKFHFAESRRRSSPSFDEAWLAGIIQIEFF
jgi:hypothetical protein